MSTENPKVAAFEQVASIARALAHPHRLGLLDLAAQRERRVEELAALSGLSIANASQHLKQLRRAGLLAARKDGQRVLYRVADAAVASLITALGQIAERNSAEMQAVIARYYAHKDGLEPVTRAELVTRLRRGAVTLLDVRPRDEFDAGHIAGAHSVPLRELKHRLDELPHTREIVAYCRGPYCVFSYEAVALLRARGFKARRLTGGYSDWRAEGRPIGAIHTASA
ncbi:MAG TPA: metalloregulator ArsR/SmtB family transcription factor [Alphaproteobacteria bacterium]|nr:metalloregulator ArsR/SmtB family transcription factor [Alphaproteobacteria bacterium]